MTPGERYRNSLDAELEILGVEEVDPDDPEAPLIEVVAYRFVDGKGFTHMRRVDRTRNWVKIETPS